MAVQEWNQVDTYNLYQSDLRGVRYSLVLENVRSSRQAEENVIIDILEVGAEQGGNSCSCSPSPSFAAFFLAQGLQIPPKHQLCQALVPVRLNHRGLKTERG